MTCASLERPGGLPPFLPLARADCNALLNAAPDNGSFDIGQEPLQIYTVVPNPGRDAVEIRFKDDVNSGGTVTLWSTTGQALRTFTADNFKENGTVRFETTDLPAGIYLIRVLANDQVYSTRWLKQ